MKDLIIGALDLETTGFLEPDHRIVEVYVGLWKNGKRFYEYEQRIDPQRQIPAEAQRVHHISTSDVIGKPVWKDIAPKVLLILSKANVIVAHNGKEFDLPFLNMENKRVGVAPAPERQLIDTMLDGVWATHDGKKPRLEELCFACGIPYDPALAHAAAYDVERMMECYFAGRASGDFAQPIPAATLHIAA